MNTAASAVYPRSRLFRNYEAQQLSETKAYPRSRLFKSEQITQFTDYQTGEQIQENVLPEWDDEDEMDFSDKSFINSK